MRGISSNVRQALDKIVDEMFDRISVNLLGHIPALKNKKTILFTSRPAYTLSHLFIESLGGRNALPQEEEALKNILSTTHDYIESLKSKTKAKVSESVDSYIKEVRSKGLTPSSSEIKSRLSEALSDAGKHLKIISEAETTKARNMGKLMNIARVGASLGNSDPTVYFVINRQTACDECYRLHMMPDKNTPRVWKMSEIGYKYHKKGEENPKVSGLHPHCNCTLTLLAENFGFKDGKVTFISEGHDEFKKQRGE